MRQDKRPADKGLPKMLNSTQVAKALGVNPSTLGRWRSGDCLANGVSGGFHQ
jgi:transposase-like protein